MAALYLFASDMPLSTQRAVSFLPGIEVTQLANDNAMDTLRDRIEVLKLALGDVPKYWLVGRGFGMERLDVLPTDDVYSGVWLQYINGCIYNGLLGSLLKTGLAGFLCSIAFIVYISRIAIKVVRLTKLSDPDSQKFFCRLSLLVCAQWFSAVAFFYTMHGDSAVWLKIFAVPAALIMLLYRRLTREEYSRVK
jgi:hypothetical protein